jgi:hypothetical protein
MGAGVGGGSVGVAAGSDVDVLVGGGVAVVVRIGDEPSDGDRQAVRRKVSRISAVNILRMCVFPALTLSLSLWERGLLAAVSLSHWQREG